MICDLCEGIQNISFTQRQVDHSTKRKCIPCFACEGFGVINPIGAPEIKMHSPSKSESNVKVIKLSDLPEGATMAHIARALDIFPSINQARKNGFDGPITLGKHVLTKRKIEVEIIS